MPLPPRERPHKVPDADLLRAVVLNSEEVTVGPTVAELADGTGLAHGPTQRRMKKLEAAGLVRPGYRGYIITDAGAKALGLSEE